MPTDLGFSYRTTTRGTVRIFRGDRGVTVLRAKAAAVFLSKAEGASFEEVQQLCARATGNYKRGNESRALLARQRKGHAA